MKVRTSSRRRQAQRALSSKPHAGTAVLTAAPAAFVIHALAPLDAQEALRQAFRLLNQAEQTLLQARSRLRAIFEDSTNPTEQADASAGLLAIERDLALIDARRLALEESTGTLQPPSDADIAEAQRLAAALADAIATSARAAAIAALAADIVKLAEKLSG